MTGRPLRAGVRRTAILISVVVVLLLGAAPAWAHSELERSDPPNGGMVAVDRSFVTLWFGEPVNLAASTFDLHRLDGTPVDVTVAPDATSGGIVRLDTEPLARATYQLDWRVLSSDDGHPSSGSVLFGVGTRPDVVPSQGAALPDWKLLLLRWLDLSALMLAIGALTVSGRVLGSLADVGDGPRRRARGVALAAAGAAVYAGVLTPFLRTMRPGNPLGPWVSETWGTLIGSPWGHLWLVREAAVMVAAVAIWSWARRPLGVTGRVSLALAALSATALVEALAGHAADLPSGSIVAAAAAAAHVVAAGIWAGGLAVLALCLAPDLRRHPDLRRSVIGSVFRAFSPQAAIASIVLVATGLYEAGRHVPGVGFVTSTVYGGTVALKLLLVTAALALAGLNTLMVHPKVSSRMGELLGLGPAWTPTSPGRFTRTVTAEAVVLTAAALAAAMLTSVPTAREVQAAAELTAPHSANVNGLFVTFEEVPAGPGLRRLLVRVRSTVLPPPAPVQAVEVHLRGPDAMTTRVPLALVEEGRYEAQTPAPDPGVWAAEVAVHRRGLPVAVSRASWVQSPPTQGTTVLEVVTTGSAVLLLVGLGAVLLLVRRRQRQRAGTPDRVTKVKQLEGSRR